MQSLITSLLRVKKTSSLLIKASTEEFLTAISIFAQFVTGKSRPTANHQDSICSQHSIIFIQYINF